MNNQQLKKAYTAWCKDELFDDNLIEAAAILQDALDLHLTSIYRRLGFADLLNTAKTPQQLVTELGYVESADWTLEAMLERLAARRTFIQKQDDGTQEAAFLHVGDIPEDETSIEKLNTRMALLGEDYVATMEFLQFGNDKFEHSLKTDPDFLDKILSGRESEHQELWFRATNVDPLQNAHGIMGAHAIDKLFDAGDILEIGGGTGAGIRNLFQHLDSKGGFGRINRYIFTDISAKFIMSTRHEIQRDYPGVDTDWRFADLNKPLSEQKIEKQSVDLIYAVNAAHVAMDLVGFLKSCRESLRPGGRVLFAERIRLSPKDMAPRELALNLSVYHRTAAIRNSDYRPMHCYLSPDNWLKAFKLAGFSDGEIWPDIAALTPSFPNQYASIVTAIA